MLLIYPVYPIPLFWMGGQTITGEAACRALGLPAAAIPADETFERFDVGGEEIVCQ
jgi:hypothetical protein